MQFWQANFLGWAGRKIRANFWLLRERSAAFYVNARDCLKT